MRFLDEDLEPEQVMAGRGGIVDAARSEEGSGSPGAAPPVSSLPLAEGAASSPEEDTSDGGGEAGVGDAVPRASTTVEAGKFSGTKVQTPLEQEPFGRRRRHGTPGVEPQQSPWSFPAESIDTGDNVSTAGATTSEPGDRVASDREQWRAQRRRLIRGSSRRLAPPPRDHDSFVQTSQEWSVRLGRGVVDGARATRESQGAEQGGALAEMRETKASAKMMKDEDAVLGEGEGESEGEDGGWWSECPR